MGTWDVGPCDSDGAADWFGDFFAGVEADSSLKEALAYDYDNYQVVRGAAYLLVALSNPFVWPGDPKLYLGHVERALALLRAMVDTSSDDENMDFLELWDGDPRVVASVQAQIAALEEVQRSRS